MNFILLKYNHNIIRHMCFYKIRLNLPRSPLYVISDALMVRRFPINPNSVATSSYDEVYINPLL